MGKFVFGILSIIIMIKVVSYINKKEKHELSVSINGSRQDTFDYLDLSKSLQVDFPNKLFRLTGTNEIFSFSELMSFKIYQNHNTITSGLNGASLNIGLGLSLMGSKDFRSSEEVKNLDIVLRTTGRNEGRYTFRYIHPNKPLKISSDEYRILIEDIEDSEEILNQIMSKR